MYTGSKAVYHYGVGHQEGMAGSDNDQELDGIAGLCVRVCWQKCTGFVGQKLHQIALACGFDRVVA